MYTFMCCGILYPDIKAALDQLELPEACMASFPARCGHPPLIPEELPGPGPGTAIGGPCLSGLSSLNSDLTLHRQNLCFYYFSPPTLVDSLQQEGGYLITPGWLCQWEKRIKEMGFDTGTARAFFRESTQKLVLLDTGIHPDSQLHLNDLSEFLEQPSQVVPVGLEYAQMFLDREHARFRYQKICRKKETAEQLAADHALVQDMLNHLPDRVEEASVIESLKELFTLLTAPETISYTPVERISEILPDPEKTPETKILADFFKKKDQRFFITRDKTRLYLKISGSRSILGLLTLTNLAFPRHISHYLNIGLNISGIFGMAIEHVRSIEKLMDASLAAGKAELATEMLHNVGNVLNSVNISAEQIRQCLERSAGSKLMALAGLVQKHSQDLNQFFSADPRGKKFPLFMLKLGEQIEMEHERMVNEVNAQLKKIKIIADIITTQHEISGCRPIEVKTDVTAIVEESLKILDPRIKTHAISIVREYQPLPMIDSQRGKLLQIFLNILSNAVDAVAEASTANPRISISLRENSRNGITTQITDNGVGMTRDVLSQVFTYGFSTKKDGHGFGLHNAANLAGQLKGSLTAESPGIGKGTTLALIL